MALKRGGTNSYTPLIQPFQINGGSTSSRHRPSSVSMRVDSPNNLGDTMGNASSKKKRGKRKRKRKIGLLYR